MSVLGVVARTHPQHLPVVLEKLQQLPGVELATHHGDGRLVLVIEDQGPVSAAARLGELATWPQLLSTSLVYEYSGPLDPSPDHHARADWRSDLQAIDTPVS
jgi:nitrate reductase NapAB chaperone NapD